jgi:hypothetical protein
MQRGRDALATCNAAGTRLQANRPARAPPVPRRRTPLGDAPAGIDPDSSRNVLIERMQCDGRGC